LADYLGHEWRIWLQANRVELNAMTTPQFIEWLDRKFADAPGKIIPPRLVLQKQLANDTALILRDKILAEVLREGQFEERVARAIKGAQPSIKAATNKLPKEMQKAMADDQSLFWRAALQRHAAFLADDQFPDGGVAQTA
jgi:hypothetical protein